MNSKIFYIFTIASFSQAFSENYDFAESVTLKSLEPYFQMPYPKVITCYGQINNTFINHTRNIAMELNKTAEEIYSIYKKDGTNAKSGLKGIFRILNKFGTQVGSQVKKDDFDTALTLMNDFRQKIRQFEAKFVSAVEYLKGNKKSNIEKYEKQFKIIRDEAKKKNTVLKEEFDKCIATIDTTVRPLFFVPYNSKT